MRWRKREGNESTSERTRDTDTERGRKRERDGKRGSYIVREIERQL